MSGEPQAAGFIAYHRTPSSTVRTFVRFFFFSFFNIQALWLAGLLACWLACGRNCLIFKEGKSTNLGNYRFEAEVSVQCHLKFYSILLIGKSIKNPSSPRSR